MLKVHVFKSRQVSPWSTGILQMFTGISGGMSIWSGKIGNRGYKRVALLINTVLTAMKKYVQTRVSK